MPPAALKAHLVLEAKRVVGGHLFDRLAQKSSADHAMQQERAVSPLAGKKIKAVVQLCHGIRFEMLDPRPFDALHLSLDGKLFFQLALLSAPLPAHLGNIIQDAGEVTVGGR